MKWEGSGILATAWGWRKIRAGNFPWTLMFHSSKPRKRLSAGGVYTAGGVREFHHSYTEEFTFPFSLNLLINRVFPHLLLLWLASNMVIFFLLSLCFIIKVAAALTPQRFVKNSSCWGNFTSWLQIVIRFYWPTWAELLVECDSPTQSGLSRKPSYWPK